MKAVILAGGTGSRLAEETDLLPKPMVQIGEHPILWHICKIYAQAGVQDFVIAAGYKGEAIAEYFSKFRLRQSARLSSCLETMCHRGTSRSSTQAKPPPPEGGSRD